MGQHDAGYRTLFSHPHLVESLISGFLPEQWTEGLDYSSLEAVSEAHATETWSMRYNDRVWRLRKRAGGWIYFYLMLEFQSTNEHFMALRTLSYIGVLYQHLRKSLGLQRGDLLPTVLPLVLYHGTGRWTATTQVFDLIEPAGRGLAEFLPHLRYYLVDVHRIPLANLEAMRTAAACLFRLEASPSLDSSRIAINDLDTILDRHTQSALRQDFARWLSEILLPSRLPGITVPEVRQLEEVRDMLTEHTIDWTAEWRMKDLEQGRQIGRLEGERALVSRLLERKFGSLSPTARRRVESATQGQVLRWSERLLTADSLAEVFDDS